MKIEKKYSGSLNLSGCTGLTALPDGLTVGDSLNLIGCTGLTALPDGLTVGGWLYLSGCTGLTALPDGLTVGGSLFMSGCTGLTALPDGLTVGGWLDLSGCTSLTGAVHGCGKNNRTICAYGSPRVVSLGCFVGNEDECISAIRGKYGNTNEADEYIEKVRIAFRL